MRLAFIDTEAQEPAEVRISYWISGVEAVWLFCYATAYREIMA
jgi:hypothetical protein